MNLKFLLLAAFAAGAVTAQNPNLDFLSNQVDGRGLRDQLPAYLRAQVDQHRREGAASAADFRARFLQGLGGLPERTPLNAKVVGRLQREGYSIEKVVFESQPGFFVTANLYLPATGKAPYPAILFPLGHEPGAKAYPVWQQILGSFARRGYVALAWDQIGQGERIQHWDEALGGSKAGPSTTEHTVIGIQCLTTGDAFARYTIWDGIRALDYLLSRPEVDPKRVGVTGNSGGGTHTAYLAALDDRLQVAAPSCFITSWQRLLDTIGPQDAEQCIPGFLGAGFEHVDFIRAFAPKPYLMLSAIRDFFSLQGARSTFGQAQEAYTSVGARDRISMAETDEGHGYSAELRIASYDWFEKWLKPQTTTKGEQPVAPASPEELACTTTGQVATSLRGETVFSLNRARADGLKTPATVTREKVRARLQWREDATPPRVRPYGLEKRGPLSIRKFLYESEPGMQIPAVLVTGPGTTSPRPGVVLVPGRGKQSAWAQIELLASRGAAVLAIDARGLGETRPLEATKGGDWQEWFGDYDSAMTSVMLGTSLVAQRAHDIQRAFALLGAEPGVDSKRIYGAAQGDAAPAMLHAAAAGVPFARLLLDGMLSSYRAVVESPLNQGIFEAIVPGALRDYDLPALCALAAPSAVLLVDSVSPMGVAAQADLLKGYAPLSNVRIRSRYVEEPAARQYEWLLE